MRDPFANLPPRRQVKREDLSILQPMREAPLTGARIIVRGDGDWSGAVVSWNVRALRDWFPAWVIHEGPTWRSPEWDGTTHSPPTHWKPIT